MGLVPQARLPNEGCFEGDASISNAGLVAGIVDSPACAVGYRGVNDDQRSALVEHKSFAVGNQLIGRSHCPG